MDAESPRALGWQTDDEASSEAASDIVNAVDIFAIEDESQVKTYRIIGYVMCGVTGVYLLLLLTLRRKIKLAVAVLKEADFDRFCRTLSLIYRCRYNDCDKYQCCFVCQR